MPRRNSRIRRRVQPWRRRLAGSTGRAKARTEARHASGFSPPSSARPPSSKATLISELFVAEADAEPARGAHERAVEIDLLRRRHRFRERHVDDPPILPGHHAVELAFGDEIDGVHAEGGGDHAVAPGGLAAAL